MSADISQILHITLEEAYWGTLKTVTLPNGANIEVKIPQGADTGTCLSIDFHGQRYLLALEIAPHVNFARQGNDLHCNVEISEELCKSGNVVNISTMSGTVPVEIPSQLPSGSTLRFPNQGMPKLNNPHSLGDLYVSFFYPIISGVSINLPGDQQQSTGFGCWFIFALLIGVGIATYFAVFRTADFPGANQIRVVAGAGQALYDRFQETDIEGEITGFHDTEDEKEQISDPAQRHLALKNLMLELTNQYRAEAGVPMVRLGNNKAAQLHAEASLAGCYSAHWDEWGLKPNHRYTLAGGTGADGENGSGSDYCIGHDENYVPISSMENEITETVDGWMQSPGHRRNLLDPAHTILNAGIAYDRFNTSMVQHFASDYVTYDTVPNIDSQGVLRLKGTVEGATLNLGRTANLQISYDPPPMPLTRGQLSYTYSLCNPIQVGWVVEPLDGGRYYIGSAVRQEWDHRQCVDPYQTAPDRPAPQSNWEANQAWAEAKAASSVGIVVSVEKVRLIAERMDLSQDNFNIRVDLAPVLREHGPGIYTTTLWGRPRHMSEPAVISERALFWMTEPPAGSPYVTP